MRERKGGGGGGGVTFTFVSLPTAYRVVSVKRVSLRRGKKGGRGVLVGVTQPTARA